MRNLSKTFYQIKVIVSFESSCNLNIELLFIFISLRISWEFVDIEKSRLLNCDVNCLQFDFRCTCVLSLGLDLVLN